MGWNSRANAHVKVTLELDENDVANLARSFRFPGNRKVDVA